VANGSEDTEVVATVDILRRGGVNVKLCSVEKNDKKPLICANNIQIVPDVHVDDVQGENLMLLLYLVVNIIYKEKFLFFHFF
jgi:putative intracellular protease/amidase